MMKKLTILISIFINGSLAFSQNTFSGRVLENITNEPIEAAVIQSNAKTISTTEDGSLSFQFHKNKLQFLISSIGNQIEQIQILLTPKTKFSRKSYFILKELVLIIDNTLQSQWDEVQFATSPILKNVNNPLTEFQNTGRDPFFLKLKMSFTF